MHFSGCLEYDISYDGNDVNDGVKEERHRPDDVASCRTLCKNYGNAVYFEYILPDAPGGRENRKLCWCKTSKEGRVNKTGSVSGVVACTGKNRVILA